VEALIPVMTMGVVVVEGCGALTGSRAQTSGFGGDLGPSRNAACRFSYGGTAFRRQLKQWRVELMVVTRSRKPWNSRGR